MTDTTMPRGAPGCTCGTPPFAPPEPSSDCPFHGVGVQCPTCGGRGWHTAGGNDPMACGRCAAGEAWSIESCTNEVERLRQALIPFAFIGRTAMEALGLAEEYDRARQVLGL